MFVAGLETDLAEMRRVGNRHYPDGHERQHLGPDTDGVRRASIARGRNHPSAPLLQWVSRLPVTQAVLSGALVIVPAYAWAAEYGGGVAAITGAYVAGDGVVEETIGHAPRGSRQLEDGR
jgi:Kef-type K+ transport system membrane component KefB